MVQKKFMLQLHLWAALSLIALSAYSCSEPASPYGQTDITLTALDASCTEVWLELKFSNLTQPANVAIQMDGKDHLRLLSLNRDTFLVIEDLEPSANYSFRAIIRYEGKDDKISNTVQVRTMDTTSHNFTWQTWTFGAGGPTAILYDGFIFDENNIWVTGHYYYNGDSHNALQWNGVKWEEKRILYQTQQGFSFAQIRSLHPSTHDNIFFSNGTRWNGKRFESIPPLNIDFPAHINKIWGTSPDNFYIAGDYGNLAQYRNGTWIKLNSGVNSDLQDIYGIWDKNNRYIIYGAATNSLSTTGEKKIFRLMADNQLNYFEWPESLDVTSVWGPSEMRLYAAGSGVHVYKNGWKLLPEIDYLYSERIRGTGHNNIFAVGHLGLVAHFNGVSWKNYRIFGSGTAFYGLHVTEKMVVIAGYKNSLGFIALGKMY
ncbi:MAG: hypothetical protein HRU80_11855 [Ignavibacteriales bacterium]|nr:MAG: hypothetical protein HRU80_11855 [Ignavibacteriales bacterium]